MRNAATLQSKTLEGRFTNLNSAPLSSITSEFQYLIIIGALWSIPVGMSLLSITQQIVFASMIVAATISGAMILTKPKVALVALPFFTLLSPVVGFLDIFDARVLLSDLLFIFLGIQMALLIYKMRTRLRSSFSRLMGLAGILYLTSSIIGLSVGTLMSWKPIVYLLQLVVVYFYTATLATEEKDWAMVINAWLVAAFLGALLVIQAYMTGQPLVDFKSGLDPQAINFESLRYLYRASYYYTGFHYVLGVAIVTLSLKVIVCTSNFTRLLILAVLLVFLTALVMMATRTAIFSVAIAIGAVLFLSSYVQKKRIFRVLLMFTILAIGSFLLFGGLVQYIGEYQADQWIVRFTGGSDERWAVFTQALTSWFSYPLQVLMGMGPDFLEGSGDTAMSAAFKLSTVTGTSQGTVDSGWISYLIELGIVSAAVLVALVVRSITALLKYLKQTSEANILDTQAVYVLGSLFFIVVALATQMLGYTKLTWLPFQLLIIGLMHAPASVPARSEKKIS